MLLLVINEFIQWNIVFLEAFVKEIFFGRVQAKSEREGFAPTFIGKLCWEGEERPDAYD